MGKINVYDKIVVKKKKKRENMEIEEIYTSPSKRKFWNGIYRLLMRADARGSAGTIYCDACRYFAGGALLMTSQK